MTSRGGQAGNLEICHEISALGRAMGGTAWTGIPRTIGDGLVSLRRHGRHTHAVTGWRSPADDALVGTWAGESGLAHHPGFRGPSVINRLAAASDRIWRRSLERRRRWDPRRVLPAVTARACGRLTTWNPPAPTTAVIHAWADTVPPVSPGIPRLQTIHDLLPLDHPAWFPVGYGPLLRRILEGLDPARDWISCPSEATRRAILRHLDGRLPPARIRVIPWAPGLGLAADADEPGILSQWDLAPRRYLIALGTRDPRKDLATACAAFRILAASRPDLRLVLVGAPGGVPVETVADPRIRITGFLPDKTVATLLGQAAALVFPSLAEGFGLPLLEAMSRGTPVVASDAEAVVEVVGPGGRCAPRGDAGAFAAALGPLLDGPEAWTLAATAARTRANAFSWKATANAYETLYEEIVTCR